MLLQPSPLTAVAFAPFGDVIQIEGHASRWINNGTCERFDDLAEVDVAGEGGRALISLFRATPRSLENRHGGAIAGAHPANHAGIFLPPGSRQARNTARNRGESPIFLGTVFVDLPPPPDRDGA